MKILPVTLVPDTDGSFIVRMTPETPHEAELAQDVFGTGEELSMSMNGAMLACMVTKKESGIWIWNGSALEGRS